MINWEPYVKSLGFKTEKEMWTELYLTQGKTINALARQFSVSTGTIQSVLRRNEIGVRSRGGAHSTKIHVTPELIDRCEKEGVPKVAKDLGVDNTSLYKAVYYRRGAKKRERPIPPLPDIAQSELETSEPKGEPDRDSSQ